MARESSVAVGVHIHSGKVRIEFRYRGERCRESLGIDPTPANIKFAARLRAEIVREMALGMFDYAARFPESPRARLLGVPSTVRKVPTFAELATAWLGSHTIAKATLKGYRSNLNTLWLPHLGDKRIDAITFADISAALASREWGTGKTRNNFLITLRRVFDVAHVEGYIDRNPADRLRNVKTVKPEPDPLTAEEVAAVLEWFGKNRPANVTNYFAFALSTGLRTSEIIELEWGDVDFPSKRLRVSRAKVAGESKGTKTNQVRFVDLNDRAFDVLRDQKALTYLEGGAVFRNPMTGAAWSNDEKQRKHHWIPCLKALGLRHRDAYQTRHTFATLLLMAGVNPAYISQQLGHANMKMLLEVYGRWVPRADGGAELAKVNAAFSPRAVPEMGLKVVSN
jgi:integrase